MCAFFHFNGIQLRWFERAFSSRDRFTLSSVDLQEPDFAWFRSILKPGPNGNWDGHSLNTALRLLADYGFIKTAPGFYLWEIHPLIHTWSHIYSQEKFAQDLYRFSKLAATVLTEVYDKEVDYDQSQIKEIRMELYAHTDAWVRNADIDGFLEESNKAQLRAYTLLRLVSWVDAPIQSLRNRMNYVVLRL